MATIASNSGIIGGKWFPYYYKPFCLGDADSALTSDDPNGKIFISHTNVVGTTQTLQGSCMHPLNCGNKYELTFGHASTDYFTIRKYDNNDDLIETIGASTESGTGARWRAALNSWVSIDVGVCINLGSVTGFLTNDKYVIELPTAEEMEKRRIYSGLSTFIKVPHEEGIAYHTDIIPENLKNRNITLCAGMPFSRRKGLPDTTVDARLYPARSEEDPLGNSAISLALEWNTNRDVGTSTVAGNSGYEWNENSNWTLGYTFADDIDASAASDIPLKGQSPSATAINYASSPLSGAVQSFNVITEGRAGHARLLAEYVFGTGSTVITAHNQWWPVYLFLG